MKYRLLGRTGLECSEIGLGTWAFASAIYGSVPEQDAVATVREALDSGINFFDTAPLYGNAEKDGIAEERLAAALGAHRSDVLISTKFGRNATENAAPNFHAARARASVEDSLRRLRRDHVDLLFFHSPFGPQDIHDDIWEALDKLRAEGKIRFVGHSISKFLETEPMCREWAAGRKIDVIQVVYSLLNRESSQLIADLSTDGVGVVARESLANGFLSGRVTRDTVFPPEHLNSRYSREEIAERVEQVDRLRFLVRGGVKSVPQAAFRWVLDDDGVSLVLSGASKPSELKDAVAASAAPPYSPDELARAEAVHQKDFEAA